MSFHWVHNLTFFVPDSSKFLLQTEKTKIDKNSKEKIFSARQFIIGLIAN